MKKDYKVVIISIVFSVIVSIFGYTSTLTASVTSNTIQISLVKQSQEALFKYQEDNQKILNQLVEVKDQLQMKVVRLTTLIEDGEIHGRFRSNGEG